ncbi:MAG: DUF1361 domain-containing protein [Chloroflexi bacterium]|nr:DUF1361 domain-containing protein [Chloroflexota bacterium]
MTTIDLKSLKQAETAVHPTRHLILIGLALAFASSLATMMVVLRMLYTGQLQFTFLVWNLFLAWLPFLFAAMVYGFRGRPFVTGVMGTLWLLFLPNALYLVTDLIHLYPWGDVPFWYDAIMLFAFALTGLMLGLVSLYLLHTVVAAQYGARIGWAFVLVVSGLSGLGVYIGRFLRWNSWDMFTSPLRVVEDVAISLLHPEMFLKTFVTTGLMTAVFILAYVVLFMTPRLAIDD